MRITVAGWEFTIGPVQAVVLGLILFAAVWLALKVLGLLAATFRFLNGDETAISRYFDRNRERKGYKALSEGMMALASGEARLALIRAQTAERLLGKPELTTLLVAQAAEASGDHKRATEAYKTLLQGRCHALCRRPGAVAAETGRGRPRNRAETGGKGV
jgi:HemY protein